MDKCCNSCDLPIFWSSNELQWLHWVKYYNVWFSSFGIWRSRWPFMKTSSNVNIFRVTGPLCGEFTGYWWIPLTKKRQCRGACMFRLICAWINGRVNNREDVNLRRHRAHYVVIEICGIFRLQNTTYTSVISTRCYLFLYFINKFEMLLSIHLNLIRNGINRPLTICFQPV